MRGFRAGLAAAAALLIMAGCGGGGGGGGKVEGPSLSLSSRTLNFACGTDETTAQSAKGVNGTITNAKSTVYLKVYFTRQAVDFVEVQLVGSTTGVLMVYPKAGETLAAGTYTDTVEVHATMDSAGTQEITGSPQTITVTTQVTAKLKVSTAPLSYGYMTGYPLPADRTLAIGGTGLNWQASTDASWIRLGATSGTAPSTLGVGIDPTGLDLGTYDGQITLTSGAADTHLVSVHLVVSRPTLQASVSGFTTSYRIGDPQPASASLALTGNGLVWTAAADQPWFRLSATGGTAPSTLTVTFDPANLAPGLHTGHLSVATVDYSDVIDLPVSLTVTAPDFNISAQSLSFTGTNGVPLASQFLDLALSNQSAGTWTATAGDPWLMVDASSGSLPGTVKVSVDPTVGPLPSGAWDTTLTLKATLPGTTLTKVVPVHLNLQRAVLTVTPETIVSGGIDGRSLAGQTLQVSLGTGANAHPWTAAVDQPWMTLAATSGAGSAAPESLGLTYKRNLLLGGNHQGNVVVTCPVNGDVLTVTVPVVLKLDAHKVLAETNGVAFTSLPGLSRLTRTLKIRDNFAAAATWTATSSQPWLAATAAGTAPGELTITADPTGLAPDNLYLATVTVASADPTVEGTDVIQVGLWVGSQPATPVSVPAGFGENMFGLVMDPVRPYAYVGNGLHDIKVFNIYTGALVKTLVSASYSVNLAGISSDGARLYLLNTGSITSINLADGTSGPCWFNGTGLQASGLVYARSNGKGLLILNNGNIFDATDGTFYGSFFLGAYAGGNLWIAASPDGSRFVNQHSDSPGFFSEQSLDFSAMDGGKVLATVVSEGTPGAGSRDIALNADGSRVYLACNDSTFKTFDGTTSTANPLLNLPGLPGNCAVAAGLDGRFYGATRTNDALSDIWTFSPEGHPLDSFKVTTMGRAVQWRTLRLSGDGLRVACLVDVTSLEIVTTP